MAKNAPNGRPASYVVPSNWKTATFLSRCSDAIPPCTIAYEPAEIPDEWYEVYDATNRRWYTDGTSKVASITTILSATDREGQRALRDWRERVGTAIADHVTETAAAGGEKWHNFAEAYVKREPLEPFLTSVDDVQKASALAHLLNHMVTRVIASEVRMGSGTRRAAGRVDKLVQLRNGRYAVLDYKTGARPKTGNRLQNYGLQSAFYARELADLLSLDVSRVVILQMLPKAFLWQVERPSTFWPHLDERIADFYRREAHESQRRAARHALTT